MLNKKALAASLSAKETDADFKQTVLLLHGDGTNGAQNNTFTDSSTNAFSITRNGNTTQGNFSPFSQADGYWGNYFDGTGDELLYGAASNWKFLSDGASSWTVEGWFFNSSTSNRLMLDTSNANGGNVGFTISFNETANTVQSDIFPTSGGSNFRIISTANAFGYNQWVHIAITYNHSTKIKKMYINGVLNATLDMTGYSFSSSNPNKALGVSWSGGGGGSAFLGNLSNIRIVKDSVVYTTDFTPSTTPLTAITGTQLLTCQSNRFIDNSSNSFSITVTGTPSVQAFSPFAPTDAYSAATNGGSGYFDGNGDYLSISDTGAQPQGTENWCVEMWVYLTTISTSTDTPWFEISSNGGIQIFTTSSGTILQLGIFGTGSITTYTLPSGVVNSWNHFVFTRSSNTFRIMHNGVLRANATNTSSLSTGTLNIFSRGASNYSTGYCGLTRVTRASIPTDYQTSSTTNGTSIYTVPTAPATTTSQGATSGDVELLLNFTNAGIIDQTAKNVLETVGNAQIDTGTKKFGTGSIKFDGSGDYLFVSQPVLLDFGTGDFTIEGWFYFNAVNTSGATVLFSTNSTGVLQLGTESDVINLGRNSSSNIISASYTSSSLLNTWTHIAVSRSGSSVRMFVNGTQIGSTATNSDSFDITSFQLGRQGTGSHQFDGYMDDVRISRVARYTANFTAPTKAFADQ